MEGGQRKGKTRVSQMELARGCALRPRVLVKALGVTMTAGMADLIGSASRLDQLCRQVYAVLLEGMPVSLTLSGLDDQRRTQAGFLKLCHSLRTVATSARQSAQSIELVIPAVALSPANAALLGSSVLGPGRLCLLPDARFFATSVEADVHASRDFFWRQLWLLRGRGRLLCAYAGDVLPSCPLLSAETADAVLPVIGLQAPAGSAWVWTPLDIARLADQAGRLDPAVLERELIGRVEAAEAMHDATRWPTAPMREDGWRNRRLAISLGGLGELVARRNADPASPACRCELEALLADIRSIVLGHSRRVARNRELLPALRANDPALRLAPGAAAGWHERWKKALETAAVGHRNLLTMSPWSLLPATARPDTRYFELLPLLEYADALSFAPEHRIGHWKFNEFIDFHRATWLALARKDRRRLVAKQV